MSDDIVGTKRDAKKKSKKAATSSSEDSGPDDLAPVRPPKKAKVETVTEKPKKKANKQEDGEDASFPLSKNKFIKVRSYHGQVLVDIREFYLAADGELRPGKKGISLNPVQWEQLKGIMADVDAAIIERV